MPAYLSLLALVSMVSPPNWLLSILLTQLAGRRKLEAHSLSMGVFGKAEFVASLADADDGRASSQGGWFDNLKQSAPHVLLAGMLLIASIQHGFWEIAS